MEEINKYMIHTVDGIFYTIEAQYGPSELVDKLDEKFFFFVTVESEIVILNVNEIKVIEKVK